MELHAVCRVCGRREPIDLGHEDIPTIAENMPRAAMFVLDVGWMDLPDGWTFSEEAGLGKPPSEGRAGELCPDHRGAA
jgi:hypothetical protein